ncbi:MAG: double zinc ribbon domain-containing protein, partial [Oscillospiraceae bacterium]|nr:double zinc ribbon domain-containing protein [Oscillospiraceae bacterium]
MTPGRWLAALLYPDRCIGCGEVVPLGLWRPDFCEKCAAEVNPIRPPYCPFCGRGKNSCGCKRRRRRYDGCVVAYEYNGAIESAILRFKHQKREDTVRFFAAAMAETVRERCEGIPLDCVVPVPMTAASRKSRGFDQSLWLAELVAESLNLPLRQALVKIFETPPQKSLPMLRRGGNVLGVFDLAENTDIADCAVLLVDDMTTTGATLDECAK